MSDPKVADLIRVTRAACNGPCDVRRFSRDGMNLFSGLGTVESIADATVRVDDAEEYDAADFPGGWSGELVLTPGDGDPTEMAPRVLALLP